MNASPLALTRRQVRRIDQLAVERYGIPSLILMENAGRNAAAILREQFGPTGSAVIFCGVGNNGGDGCVMARHLHNHAWTVRLAVIGDPSKMTTDASVNFGIVKRMGVPISFAQDVDSACRVIDGIRLEDVVVDALLGTGFHGEVRPPLAETIDALNVAPRRAMAAVDLPSGLDCDTGVAARATIRADLTITFVAFKHGFLAPQASKFTGRILVADIGSPRELLDEVLRERLD